MQTQNDEIKSIAGCNLRFMFIEDKISIDKIRFNKDYKLEW